MKKLLLLGMVFVLSACTTKSDTLSSTDIISLLTTAKTNWTQITGYEVHSRDQEGALLFELSYDGEEYLFSGVVDVYWDKTDLYLKKDGSWQKVDSEERDTSLPFDEQHIINFVFGKNSGTELSYIERFNFERSVSCPLDINELCYIFNFTSTAGDSDVIYVEKNHKRIVQIIDFDPKGGAAVVDVYYDNYDISPPSDLERNNISDDLQNKIIE